MVEKLAYIVASLCEGDLFSYLFSVLTKISYNLGKKRQNSDIFLITQVAQKIQSEKFRQQF